MNKDKIEGLLDECEMLLIGIGSDFGEHPGMGVDPPGFSEGKRLYEQINSGLSDRQTALYDRLYELIGGKNYFIVDTNYDGLIYRSRLNEMRIVSPCGNIDRVQCGCKGEEGIHAAKEIYSGTAQRCPVCGMEYVPNIHGTEGYNESAYLKKWEFYNKWISGTLNKKLVMLELGADFKYAAIIRWPFEKIAMIHNKAVLIRIHEKFPQGPPEIKDKMISVPLSTAEFLKSM